MVQLTFDFPDEELLKCLEKRLDVLDDLVVKVDVETWSRWQSKRAELTRNDKEYVEKIANGCDGLKSAQWRPSQKHPHLMQQSRRRSGQNANNLWRRRKNISRISVNAKQMVKRKTICNEDVVSIDFPTSTNKSTSNNNGYNHKVVVGTEESARHDIKGDMNRLDQLTMKIKSEPVEVDDISYTSSSDAFIVSDGVASCALDRDNRVSSLKCENNGMVSLTQPCERSVAFRRTEGGATSNEPMEGYNFQPHEEDADFLNTFNQSNMVVSYPPSDLEQADKPHKLLQFAMTLNEETHRTFTRRRRCRMCYQNGHRKDTSYFCYGCPGQPALCKKCFFEYHRDFF